MSRVQAASLGASLGLCVSLAAAGPHAIDPGSRRPDAVVDLATPDGARLVRAEWRFAAARIVEAENRAPGADLAPSGAPVRTFDVAPRADAPLEGAVWEAIDPRALETRRSTGKLSFGWYRTSVTLPERVGALDSILGTTVLFEVVVDDYSEVWVDGRLAPVLGQRGGGLVSGFNAPNRVVLTRDARAGQIFEIAVFGANGPLSAPPRNFVWIRSATLDFYRPERFRLGRPAELEVVRLDPALDRIVPAGATLELLAEGFSFAEGPVWHPDGYLLFSDPNDDAIYRWDATTGELSVHRVKSGYSGADIGEFGQPGSNGLALDAEGRLTICEHGNRRVTRIERNGAVTVLAERFDGRRLNSPNDLVYRADGALYFTDPPFGLPAFHDDPRRELPWTGVYLVRGARIDVVSRELAGPNGLALSPDERFLYVANWDVERKVVTRYPVLEDGALGRGEVFFDMAEAAGSEALDGLKVDREGNLYVSGPGGVWILSADGRHLGTLQAPRLPANFAWGDADGRTLYMTARDALYRIRLGIPGSGTRGSTALRAAAK